MKKEMIGVLGLTIVEAAKNVYSWLELEKIRSGRLPRAWEMCSFENRFRKEVFAHNDIGSECYAISYRYKNNIIQILNNLEIIHWILSIQNNPINNFVRQSNY